MNQHSVKKQGKAKGKEHLKRERKTESKKKQGKHDWITKTKNNII